MSCLAEISMFPTDVGESKSKYVAEVLRIIDKSGLKYQLTPMSTIIEADSIDEIVTILPEMYRALDAMGVNRVYSIVKFDIRKNRDNRMEEKVNSVFDKIQQSQKKG